MNLREVKQPPQIITFSPFKQSDWERIVRKYKLPMRNFPVKFILKTGRKKVGIAGFSSLLKHPIDVCYSIFPEYRDSITKEAVHDVIEKTLRGFFKYAKISSLHQTNENTIESYINTLFQVVTERKTKAEVAANDAKIKSQGKWIGTVHTVSTFPPRGTFAYDRSGEELALIMAQPRISPKGLGSAIKMVQYFINRAGKKMPEHTKKEFEKAIVILQKMEKK